jgi:hypothetical protein
MRPCQRRPTWLFVAVAALTLALAGLVLRVRYSDLRLPPPSAARPTPPESRDGRIFPDYPGIARSRLRSTSLTQESD